MQKVLRRVRAFQDMISQQVLDLAIAPFFKIELVQGVAGWNQKRDVSGILNLGEDVGIVSDDSPKRRCVLVVVEESLHVLCKRQTGECCQNR